MYKPSAFGKRDFGIHVQEPESSLLLGLSVWNKEPSSGHLPAFPQERGNPRGMLVTPHLTAEKGSPPDLGAATSCLRSSCTANMGRNCSAKQKTMDLHNFSPCTQLFHHQKKILKPGLEILVMLEAELGLSAGHGWTQLGHFPLPSLPLRLVAWAY